jgi:hypothetical protein
MRSLSLYSYRKINASWVWWLRPVISALQKELKAEDLRV